MMTASKAKKLFDRLQKDILADGAVDLEETSKLLKFIEENGRADKEPFASFAEVLKRYRQDGKITSEESAVLVEWIGVIRKHLDIEDSVSQEAGLAIKILIAAWVMWLIAKTAATFL